MRSFDVEMSRMKRVNGSASWNSNAMQNHKVIRKVALGSNASYSFTLEAVGTFGEQNKSL